jgi:hypothetical protein
MSMRSVKRGAAVRVVEEKRQEHPNCRKSDMPDEQSRHTSRRRYFLQTKFVGMDGAAILEARLKRRWVGREEVGTVGEDERG